MRVGVKFDAPPAGVLNPSTNEPEGSDIDFARLIATALLGSPDSIEFTQVTAANRMPLVESGELDMSIATMTITPEREEELSLVPYWPSATGIMVPAGSDIHVPSDIAGKRLCVPTGIEQLTTDFLKRVLDVTVTDMISLASLAECATAIKQGRADYVVADWQTFVGLAATIDGVVVLPDLLDAQAWGIGISLDHPELTEFVEGVLNRAYADGDWLNIWDRWNDVEPPAGWPPAP